MGEMLKRAAASTLGIGFGLTLAVILVCGGSFVACTGLMAVGRVESERIEREQAETIEISNVRLTTHGYGRASTMRRVNYAADFKNTGTQPLEISGWLKILDEQGIEIGRDRITTTIPAGQTWTTEGYTMDQGSGTPTTLKYTGGW